MNHKPIDINDLDNALIPLNDAALALTPEECASLQEENRQLVYELEQKIQEFDAYKRRFRATDILDKLIEPYSSRIFWFMVIYCGSILLVLLMNAFGCFKNPIESSVLQFLVGSTATTVLGLVGMVVTGIFAGARRHSD